MKFTFDRDAMLKEIAIAQQIISIKNVKSILSTVCFIAENNTLFIKATDIKICFETKIPVDVEEEGSTTVHCDKFISILNKLPSGDIQFIQDETTITIKPISKKVSFKLKAFYVDKFPEFSTTTDINYFDIPTDAFKSMICQTIFAISDDQTRYFMNGVYFEKKEDNLILVATDGRRLSYVSKPLCEGINQFESAIVPPKILSLILKRAPSEGFVSIAILDRTFYVKFGNYYFTSVLIEGKFPNYERIIPESQKFSFAVDKHELQEAMSRVGLMVDRKSLKTFFQINPGVLTIYTNETEFGDVREEIPCQYDGEELLFALNFQYVEEPLKAITTDRVVFKFTESMKAITMCSEPEEDYFHLIMPMQLD